MVEKEKVSILFENRLSRKTPVPSIHSRSFRKSLFWNARINPVLQDNLLPKDFTKYVYHVGHRNELRSILHNGLVPGGFSTKTGRCAVFFTVVDPLDDEQGLLETFCNSSESKDRASQENLETSSRQYVGAIYCPLKKEDCNLTKLIPMRSSSMTLRVSRKTSENSSFALDA